MSTSALTDPTVHDADEQRLNDLGYQQELKRGMGGFSNFAGTLHIDGTFQWSLFNYAPIAVGVVLGYATLSWFLSARHWFTGPKWSVDGAPLDVETEVPPLGHKHDDQIGAQL